MRDPERLMERGGLARAVLESARQDRPGAAARARTAAALGVAGLVGTAVVSGGAGAAGAGTPSVAGVATAAATKAVVGAGGIAAPAVGVALTGKSTWLAGLAAQVGAGLAGKAIVGTAVVVATVGGVVALDRGFQEEWRSVVPVVAPVERAPGPSEAERVEPLLRQPALAELAPQSAGAPAKAPPLPRAPSPKRAVAAPPTQPRPSQLAAEMAEIAQARRALAEGDPTAAMTALGRIPETGSALGEEVEVLWIEALLAAGSPQAAAERSVVFLEAHPATPHEARIQFILRRATRQSEEQENNAGRVIEEVAR